MGNIDQVTFTEIKAKSLYFLSIMPMDFGHEGTVMLVGTG
jgi:hypothetical protein